MALNKFIEILKNSIDGLEEQDLSSETKLCDIDEWDSLAVLSVISMADIHYKVRIKGDDIQACQTIHDIEKLISKELS